MSTSPKPTYAASRVIKWSISAVGTIGLTYLGTHGHTGLGNLCVFFAWFAAVLGFFAVSSDRAREEICRRGRSVPDGVAIVANALPVIICIESGWWLTGIAFLLGAIFEEGIYTEIDSEPATE